MGNFSDISVKKIIPSAWPKWIVIILGLLIIGTFVLWGVDFMIGGSLNIYPYPVYQWMNTEPTDKWKAERSSPNMVIPSKFNSCNLKPGKGIVAFNGGSGIDVDRLGATCWDKTNLKEVGGQGGNPYKIENEDGFDSAIIWADQDTTNYMRGIEFYRLGEKIGETGTIGTEDNKMVGTALTCLPREVISGIKVAAQQKDGKDFRVGFVQLECSGPKVIN